MKTRKEIAEYLGIELPDAVGVGSEFEKDFEGFIVAGKVFENKPEFKKTGYGYGLACDFNSNPEILELLNENQELEKVEELNGVIFYKIVNKGA